MEEQQKNIAAQLAKIDQDIHQMNAEEDLIEEKRQTLAQESARLQAAFAVQKEQVAHLQQKIAATNQALEENEARQLSLERQLAALTSNVSDYEFSEESILQRIEAFTKTKQQVTAELTVIREQRQVVQQEIGALDEALSAENLTQKEKLSEKTEVEIEKNRAELVMDNRLLYLQEEYNLTCLLYTSDAADEL